MIYVSIPAHNEAATLGAVLWKIRRVMAEFERDYEIVVFDDASTDATPEVLQRYQEKLPLRVLRSDSRVGYGQAVERLMRDAVERAPYPKRDVVVTLQADFTEDPADLVPMIKAIEGGADLVGGHVEGIDVSLPRPRRFCDWIARRVILARTVKTAPVRDPLSGYRAYRIIVLKKAFRGETETELPTALEGAPASLELLSLTAPFARRIEDAPYRLRYAHRERPSRYEPLPSLKALLPYRRLRWSPAEEVG